MLQVSAPKFDLQEFDQLPDLMGSMAAVMIIGLLLYLYFSLMLMIIARKSNTPNAWLAWIPLANLFLLCRIARKPGWWVLLLLIPLVNLIAGVVIWMRIAEARGKPAWSGVLVIVPFLNLVAIAYLAAGQVSQAGFAAETRTCPDCGAMVEANDTFCGGCGRPAPAVSVAPPASRGKMSPVGVVAIVALVAVIGGISWFAFRGMSYSPPNRQQPELPKRAAGTITEFPVDTDPNSPARPSSVITQNFPPGGSRSSSQKVQVPEKWLPPGVDPKSLPQRAEAMTSATYRTQPRAKEEAATSADEIYVHVLDTSPNRSRHGEEIANAVDRATDGERTGIRVNSPDGDLYTGSRIRTPQISVYVLTKQNSGIVIIIYAPSPEVVEVAERLTRNVGNGEGLNDYPEVQSSLWTLPAAPPSDLVLQEVNTLTAGDMESSLQQIEGVVGSSAEIQQLLSQVRQFIPERLTNARYQDRGRQDWNIVIGDYGSTRRAWMTWMLLRWTAGISVMRSVPMLDSEGLYADDDGDGQAMLIFHKGPYLILVAGPSATSVESLIELANKFQV